MAENTAGITDNRPTSETTSTARVSRWGFLKKGAVAIIAASGLGAMGKREVEVISEGLETKDGVFFPLYENHELGITAKDLPPKLDGLFREGGIATGGDPPLSALELLTFVHPTFNQPLFQNDALGALARQQVKVIMGDAYINSDIGSTNDNLRGGRIATSLVLIGGPLLTEVNRAMDRLVLGKNSSESTRRKFLKLGVGGTGAALLSPVLAEMPLKNLVESNPNIDQKDAIQRIALRLQGMTSNLQPENSTLFFRNLIMVDNILTAAEVFSKEFGRKPRIAFNVGGAHSGIEDFLIAGHDFVRFLIANHPKEFLKTIAEENGGLENLCSARIFTLPNNLDPIQLRDSQIPNIEDEIKETRIVDKPLLEFLRTRFVEEEAQEKEKRLNEINNLKESFRKHVDKKRQNQIFDTLDELASVSENDYKKKVRIMKPSGTEEGFYSIGIKLTNTSEASDLSLEQSIKNGEVVYERVSFFLDNEGNLTQNKNRADVIVVPQEQLSNRVNDVFPQSPKDTKDWDYVPSGTSGAPLPGQAYLRSKTSEDFPKSMFQISQDGRMEATTWYKE